MVRKQVLTDSETKIIQTLAKNGKTNYNSLLNNEELSLSNRTVLDSVKYLEYMKLIKSELGPNESESGRGRKATYYKLTPDGLKMSLYYWKDLQDLDLNNIIKVNSEMFPLIFGKWNFFIKNNLEAVAVDRLKVVIESQGTILEKLVESRRKSMKTALANEEFNKILLTNLKKKLVGSEKNRFPKDPVFMSELELEKYIKALFKEKRDLLIKSGHFEQVTNLASQQKAEDTIGWMKDLKDDHENSSVKHFTETFFFGGYGTEVNPEAETHFLKTVVKDNELQNFVIDCLSIAERRYENYLENIRSWKLIAQKTS